MTSLYSHDIIFVSFQWIIKKDYKNKYFVTGDWSQSTPIRWPHNEKDKTEEKAPQWVATMPHKEQTPLEPQKTELTYK